MVIPDNQETAEIFMLYFDIIVTKLGLSIPKYVIFATNGIQDPVLNTVHKYQRHPSIFAIKENYKGLNFSFFCKSLSNLQNELKRVGSSKSVLETAIPTKVLKENIDIFNLFFLIISIV